MKYILGVLAVIVLLIVAVVLIATTGNGGSEQEGRRQLDLTQSINTDSSVSLTEEGELVGDDTRRAIKITVSPSERRVELLSGYNNSVERSETSSNTQAAYDTFLRALSNAGFSREKDAEIEDSRGVCPLGRRFIYVLHEQGQNKLYLWSTTCGNKDGTFGGDDGLVRRLFQNQITNYPDFVRGVRL